MNEEKALKEIHKIREEIYLMDKEEKKNLLEKIVKIYRTHYIFNTQNSRST